MNQPARAPFRFNTTPDAADWTSGYWLTIRHRWLWRRLLCGILLIWVCYCALLIGLDTLDNGWLPERAAWQLANAADYTLVLVPLLILVTLVLTPSRIRNQVRDAERLAPVITFEFDTDGLRTKNAISSTEMAWAQFERWLENDKVIVLMITRQSMFFIRKSELDPAVLTEFRAQLAVARVPKH